jgi:predicted outer membrane protein
MMTHARALSSWLVAAMLLASSCGNSGPNHASDSVDSAGNLNRTKFDTSATSMNTADLLVSLYATGLYDQQASVAVGKHKAPRPVAALATQIGNAQASMNTGIAGLAEKKHVSLPQTLSEDQYKQLQGMIQPGGIEMGRSYVRQITNDQKQMLVTLQQAAQSNDTDVIHWAEDATARIQEMADKTGKVQRYLDSVPLGRNH